MIEKLIRDIEYELRAQPYDLANNHPTNKTISDLIINSFNDKLMLVIVHFYKRPGFLANIISSMRDAKSHIIAIHYFLIKDLLKHTDLQVRDSCVTLLEHWDTSESRKVLQDHLPFESTPWLVEYIEKVLHAEN
ncbi:hypothetical protein C4588_03670 [Candidatus Parcubacteria bacterium]|nr:MAG: hypothetical protein C4588_03670 [Candidatus Parcubacteria bacterium]